MMAALRTLCSLSLLMLSASAFNSVRPSTPTKTLTELSAEPQISRRELFSKVAAAGLAVGGSVFLPFVGSASAAASNLPTAEELERIKVGHEQIVYLLNNFEKETTVCRENGGECKRNAEPVRKYMGLRSTTDPLFQIEKVFAKVKNMDLDPDKLEGFFDATEDWNSAMNMSNSMAFISQFGEYNPGGGVDEVLKYLEESRKQVTIAEKALRTIMDCLDISPS
uniref:Uncharacterized protein n=1 Tax=Grammatophora oceanica TaxID=210454 RepID=A0A7S1V9Y0_9STRA